MRKRIALLLVLALLLSGCAVEDSPYVPTGDALDEDQIQLPTQAQPNVALALAYYPGRSMNPYACTDFTNRIVLSLMYQGLFTADRDYQVSPVLCGRYMMSRDMRTYIFYVNSAAAYSDGTSVTGADVTASLLAAKESAYYSGRFNHVVSVKTLDDGGVEVVLNTPNENFPILLDVPIVKASQVEADNPLGSGPYVLEDTVSGRWLRRQNHWWCKSTDMITDAAYIPLTAVETVVKARDAFEAQDVSLVCTDPGNPSYADFRCDYELWDCESGSFLYLSANPEGELFSNAAVRNALTHAINREYLVDTFYRGFAQEAMLPASPSSPYYNQKLASQYGYDKEAFAKAVEDAGLVGTEILLLLNSDDGTRLRVGREIERMLEEAGIVVQLMELNHEQFMIHVEWYQYDLYLGQAKLSPNMDLSEFFATEGAMNYNNMSDPAMYALSLEALANDGNYYTLHKTVMEDGRLCPILFRDYAIYTQRGMFSQLSAPRDNLFQYTIGVTMEEILADMPVTEQSPKS